MKTNLQIALRFLLSRKRAMLMSLGGIIFGVGFFIITQAQTSGFERFFIKTIFKKGGNHMTIKLLFINDIFINAF